MGLSKNKSATCSFQKLFVKARQSTATAYRWKKGDNARDRRLDRLLTSKATGIPIMLALLFLIFWITISGANYPSELLFRMFSWIEARLWEWFAGAPPFVSGLLIGGMYRVLSWVVSVMLPANGNLLPAVYLVRGFGISTADCL